MYSRIGGMQATAIGTGGGPIVSSTRAGTSTAVTVAGRTYVVDCGMGSVRNFRANHQWGQLRAIFLTHLHSDHIYDLGSFLVTGWEVPGESFSEPIQVLGPAKPEELPAFDAVHSVEMQKRAGNREMVGTAEMVRALLASVFGSDVVIRMCDEGRSDPERWIKARDIQIPESAGAHPVRARCPEMDPFLVYRDDFVDVTATLVDHRLCYPSFGFRFDSEFGSVVISGDTAYCGNVIKLAKNADLLFHEVMDLEAILATLPDGPTRAGIEEHLRESHTSFEDVGKVASIANVHKLVLHHVVPNTPGAADLDKIVQRVREDFSGDVVVAEDQDVFEVGHEN